MTPSNKRVMQKSIEHLQTDCSTNLWAGIKAGLDVFERAAPLDNVQGLYILTDGQPNCMCPAQGYAAKLKPLLAKAALLNRQVPTIHTFGFGYDIRSGLLQTIAEIGLGSYAFIPDAGMIGTVFVHAVANLFTTYATQAVLTIRSSYAEQLKCSMVFNSSLQGDTLTLRLGNLQYGQSRDTTINYPAFMTAPMQANLRYVNAAGQECEMDLNLDNDTAHPNYYYHVLRSQLCESLANFFPKLPNGEHQALSTGPSFQSAKRFLFALGDKMQAASGWEGVTSLLLDLVGDTSEGQITQALHPAAWRRWGQHFLPSLLHAYARQVCNSFKDPGPLEFGKDSILFNHCKDELDAVFENLPPPKPSRAHVTPGKIVTNFSMARFHKQDMGCFAGGCLIRLADDSKILVEQLRPQMLVWTPMGSRMVDSVVRTVHCNSPASAGDLVQVGDAWLTPWHPIQANGKWAFPDELSLRRKLCDEDVYSILLEAGGDSQGHAVEINGQVCVTLGHGVVDCPRDARSHVFFGDHDAVRHSLQCLPLDKKGQRLTQGLRRDSLTRLVCGWQPYLGARCTGAGPRL